MRAAGGVVLGGAQGEPQVLLVYRSRYDDWTLPKGKGESDETDEACALREVEEETGLRCELLDEGPSTTYLDRRGRNKRVRYWAMRVVGGEARAAPPEVDEVRWVPISEAMRLLTHEHDARVLETIVGRFPGRQASA